MANLESSVGHPLTMHLHYLDWNTLLGGTGETVQQIFQDDIDHGRAPIISLNCLDNYKGQNFTLNDIANKKADADLGAMSTALEALKDKNGNSLPIFIRYFWEFNLNISPGGNPNANNNGGCFTTPAPGDEYTDQFINAWIRIWQDFNLYEIPRPRISLVWNPNVSDSANDDSTVTKADAYYPGAGYVDWIGLDGYNKQVETSINPPVFTPIGFNAVFYNTLSTYATPSYGKPIMIGETGSCSSYSAAYDQQLYLEAVASILGNNQNNSQSPYSYVKAINYFHAPGTYVDKNNGNGCDYDLQGSGLSEFDTLANSMLFSPKISMP